MPASGVHSWHGGARRDRGFSRCCWDSKRRRDGGRHGTWSWVLPAECARRRGGAWAGSPGGGVDRKKKKGARYGAPANPKAGVSGVRADGSGPGHDGAAIALAQHAQLVQLGLGQVGEAIRKIEQRVVEPFLLMLWRGFQHSAAEDVREQLVARLFEACGNRVLPGLTTLFGHAGVFLSTEDLVKNGAAR